MGKESNNNRMFNESKMGYIVLICSVSMNLILGFSKIPMMNMVNMLTNNLWLYFIIQMDISMLVTACPIFIYYYILNDNKDVNENRRKALGFSLLVICSFLIVFLDILLSYQQNDLFFYLLAALLCLAVLIWVWACIRWYRRDYKNINIFKFVMLAIVKWVGLSALLFVTTFLVAITGKQKRKYFFVIMG